MRRLEAGFQRGREFCLPLAKVEYHPCGMAILMDSLDHLVLTVANIDITVDFYTEVLGLELVVEGGRKALAAQVEAIVRRGQTRALAGNYRGEPSTPEPAVDVQKGELAEAAA